MQDRYAGDGADGALVRTRHCSLADVVAGRGRSDARCISARSVLARGHRLVTEVVAAWGTISTLSDGRPNRIVEVTDTGVLVQTGKSADDGDGPKVVNAWMVEVAWEHLRTHGSLQQSYLVATDGLNVKRSAFVMALLSKFPGVTIASSRPSELTFGVAGPSDMTDTIDGSVR